VLNADIVNGRFRRRRLNSNGLVLTDTLFRPIFADMESLKILRYPYDVHNPAALEDLLTQQLYSFLQPERIISSGETLTQFQSGRRRYLCRAFVLHNHWDNDPKEAKIAILFERGLSDPPTNARKRNRIGGMYEDPFSFSPDPRYYSFSRAHLDVLASIRSLIREGRGIGVLIGQGGMGKTVLVSYLAETLRMECDFVYLAGTYSSRAEMLHAVMAAFGIEEIEQNVSSNLARFEKWLLDRHLSGRRSVLVYDNAQDYDANILENLCMFSDMQAGQQKLLQVLIIGRQGVIEKISGSRQETVGNKINVFCRLTPMDGEEVRSYVLHRLKIAGCTRQLFNSEALHLITLYSRGIPLNINMICRHCISLASTVNMQIIDERLVDDAAYDLVLKTHPFSDWNDLGIQHDASKSKDKHFLRLVKSSD
jgi:general secretion pathway protein A